MINEIPYIKSPTIDTSISPRVIEKLNKFYNKLHQKSIDEAKELKFTIKQFLF